MTGAQLHRRSIVISIARSYWKRTRSVVEAQKSQSFTNAGAFAAMSNF